MSFLTDHPVWGYLPYLMEGVLLTIELTLLSSIITIFLGIFVAVGKLSKNPLVRLISGIYTSIVRGVPDLIMMLLIFYGGQVLVNDVVAYFDEDLYVDINAFVAGVFTIAFIYGAYMAETFRGAIQSIHKGQIEVAESLGMSPFTVFRRITFQQMMKYAIPGINNNIVLLLKTTALVSVIGLNEMVRRGNIAGQKLREPFLLMLLVAGMYLIFTLVVSAIFKRLDKKYHFTT